MVNRREMVRNVQRISSAKENQAVIYCSLSSDRFVAHKNNAALVQRKKGSNIGQPEQEIIDNLLESRRKTRKLGRLPSYGKSVIEGDLYNVGLVDE